MSCPLQAYILLMPICCPPPPASGRATAFTICGVDPLQVLGSRFTCSCITKSVLHINISLSLSTAANTYMQVCKVVVNLSVWSVPHTRAGKDETGPADRHVGHHGLHICIRCCYQLSVPVRFFCAARKFQRFVPGRAVPIPHFATHIFAIRSRELTEASRLVNIRAHTASIYPPIRPGQKRHGLHWY